MSEAQSMLMLSSSACVWIALTDSCMKPFGVIIVAGILIIVLKISTNSCHMWLKYLSQSSFRVYSHLDFPFNLKIIQVVNDKKKLYGVNAPWLAWCCFIHCGKYICVLLSPCQAVCQRWVAVKSRNTATTNKSSVDLYPVLTCKFTFRQLQSVVLHPLVPHRRHRHHYCQLVFDHLHL